MPYVAVTYTNDNDFVSAYSVVLDVGYEGQVQTQDVIADPLIPGVLLPYLKWFNRHPCPSKQIVPRTAIASLKSDRILKISYPFKPNTPQWYTFWQQLQSPEIISIESVGEKITDKHLRHSLNL